MVFSLLLVVCVGDLRSWSDMECGTFPSSITDAGGTTPHFSQQAIGSSIHASSNISLDHSVEMTAHLFELMCTKANAYTLVLYVKTRAWINLSLDHIIKVRHYVPSTII